MANLQDLEGALREVLRVGWDLVAALRSGDVPLVQQLVAARQVHVDAAEGVLFAHPELQGRILALAADVRAQDEVLVGLAEQAQCKLGDRLGELARRARVMATYADDLTKVPGGY